MKLEKVKDQWTKVTGIRNELFDRIKHVYEVAKKDIEIQIEEFRSSIKNKSHS